MKLNHYRLLGRSGLRVSPLCLGTMTFGTEWEWGSEMEESRLIFESYAEHGGNFIDTANNYTDGTSEMWIGEFLRGRRDRFVLGTKYTMNAGPGDPNAAGNHRKNLKQSIEASLSRLQTDYIDLYWVHAWDGRTPADEVMRALDDLIREGKILYTGISNAPAWKISQSNTLAELRGWTRFIALQVEYNLAERAAERELIPMACELGLAVMPWSPLAGGVLSGKYSREDLEAGPAGNKHGSRAGVIRALGMLTERSLAIADEVKAVAREIDRTPSQVALAWVLQMPCAACPVIGARSLRQLDENLSCLEFQLEKGHFDRLDRASRIEPGYPHDFLRRDMIRKLIDGGTFIS